MSLLTINRPIVPNFSSAVVEQVINSAKNKIENPVEYRLFAQCFPNTLDTTVSYQWKNDKPDTYVITGDINAMWLRDSTAQVWPYLPLLTKDPELKKQAYALDSTNHYMLCLAF